MEQNTTAIALLRRLHSLLDSPESPKTPMSLCERDAVILYNLFRELATCTHAAGMEAFAGLCLRVTEQLARMVGAGHVSGQMLAVMREWIELAARYLAARVDVSRALALVECFSDERWERRCDRAERAALLQELVRSVPPARPVSLH
jgi:hypothetical protein